MRGLQRIKKRCSPLFIKVHLTNRYLPPVIGIPSSLLITAITQASPMVITVSIGNAASEANTYIPGMAIKLFVPITCGMFQANNLIGTITAVNGLKFTLNIDSSQFDAFLVPSGLSQSPASISPNGSRNLQYNNDNVDSVPFQNLNNIGN